MTGKQKRVKAYLRMAVLSFLLTGMLCACGRSTEEERREVPENVRTGAGLTAEAVAGEEAPGESEAVADGEAPGESEAVAGGEVPGESEAVAGGEASGESEAVAGGEAPGESESVAGEEPPEESEAVAEGESGDTFSDNAEKPKLLSESLYDLGGNLCVQWLYIYDDRGNLAAEENYSRITQTLHQRNDYAYDDQGRCISWCWRNYRGFENRQEYVYDDQGRVLSIYYYEGGDTPTSREEYTYDEQGLKTEIRKYEGDAEERVSVEIFQYDEYGNLLSDRLIDKDGILISRTTNEYTYDEQGTVLEKHMCILTEWVNRDLLFRYVYDENGRVTEEYEYSLKDGDLAISETGFVWTDVKTDDTGILLWHREYDYDDQGNVLVRRDRRADGVVSDYWIYTYEQSDTL